MRYLKYLQRAGLVLTLLIVGVFAGLMAPLPSEAVVATLPVIKIEVKQAANTTGELDLPYLAATDAASACPAIDPITLWGPNYCYRIKTVESHGLVDNITKFGPAGFKVEVHDEPGQIARLQIQDFNSNPGASPSDGMRLSGIKLVPVPTGTWNADSSVEIKVIITVTNTFDAQLNPTATAANARRLPWTMSTAGYYEQRATSTQTFVPTGDSFELFGEGTFVTTGNPPVPSSGQPKGLWNFTADPITGLTNRTADKSVNANACLEDSAVNGQVGPSNLCFELAAAEASGAPRQVTFNDRQRSPYPGSPSSQPQSNPDQRFFCTNNLSGSISVTDPKNVTRTYTNPQCVPKVKQIHRFTLKGPDIAALTGSEHGGGLVCNEDGTANQLPQCEGTVSGNKLTATEILNNFNQTLINQTLAGLPDVPAGIRCTTAKCNGNLTLSIRLTPTEPVDETFAIRLDGPRVEDKPITVPAGSTTSSPNNDITFTQLITGAGGSKIVIQPDYANWPQAPDGSFFQADQVQLTSSNGSTNINPNDPNADVIIVSRGGIKCGVIIRAIKQDASGNGDTIGIDFHAHNSKKRPVSCNLQ